LISWLTKTPPVTAGAPSRRPGRWLAEFSGAFGDLGTFLPYVLGALTLGGLAPQGVLLGFGLALIGAGRRLAGRGGARSAGKSYPKPPNISGTVTQRQPLAGPVSGDMEVLEIRLSNAEKPSSSPPICWIFFH